MFRDRMRSVGLLFMGLFVFYSVALYGQSDKKYIRQGNREFNRNNFAGSEISYRKAIDKNKQSPEAVFNAGDAMYKQNKFDDASGLFMSNISMSEDKERKAAGLYNLGNSLLKANKIEQSIEAYKNSLKLDPDSKEAKYNLAYAQDLLRKQQQQKNQQNQNQQDKNKDNKKDDQKKDNDQQNDQNKDQKQQQKQNQQEISRDDAERLLNSLANDEKNVQEKVKLAKAAKEKVRTTKNW